MTKLTGFRWLDLRSPVRALSRCNAPFSSRLSCSPMNAGHRMDAFHFPSFALLVTGQIEKHRVKRIPHNFFVNCVLPNFGLHTRDFSDIGASLLLGLWILRYFGRYFSFFFDKWLEFNVYFIVFLRFLAKIRAKNRDSCAIVTMIWKRIFQKE